MRNRSFTKIECLRLWLCSANFFVPSYAEVVWSAIIRSGPFRGGHFKQVQVSTRCAIRRVSLRPGRDFHRHGSRKPARCQRINVSGRTTTSAERHANQRERNARLTRVAASIRRATFHVEGELSAKWNLDMWCTCYQHSAHVKDDPTAKCPRFTASAIESPCGHGGHAFV